MGRGRTPLTADEIVTEALRLIDSGGLEALSMRRLGSALGVEAMSIYNHVPDKEALLHAVVDHLLNEIRVPEETLPWKERVVAGFAELRRLLLEHPRALPLFVGPPRWTERGLELAEQLLAVLAEGGLDGDESIRAHRVLLSYTIGHSVVEVGLNETAPEDESGPVRPSPGKFDAGRFPQLARMVEQLTASELEDTFHTGLQMIVDGFDRAAAPRSPVRVDGSAGD